MSSLGNVMLLYFARHGLVWWQIDIIWIIIQFLQFLGLARNVKLYQIHLLS